MTRTEPNLAWLANGLADWQKIQDLVTAAQYEQVAESLVNAQQESERSGQALLADILAATCQICLACSQCRTGAEWHWRAYEEIAQRELALRQLLGAILLLISEPGVLETLEKPATLSLVPSIELKSPVRDLHSLWQRVQGLIGRGSSSQPVTQATPLEPVEALVTPPLEEVETVTPPPAEPVKIQSAISIQQAEDKVKEEQGLRALVVYCLGPFRVYQNDQLITEWNSLKGQSILKYLVMQKGGPVAKDVLMDVFWPDADPGDTRRNLHQAIYSLRQTLRGGQVNLQPVLFKKDCYLLNPELAIWLDFEEFEKHVQAGRRLEITGQLAEAMAESSIAEGLYQGDFLEEDLYEDWPTLPREHLRNLYLDIANRLSEYYIQQGEYAAAIALCQKILAKDNCYEEAYRRLMRCYLAQRQRHLAVRQYQTCVQALKEELDLPPSEETVALYQRITSGA